MLLLPGSEFPGISTPNRLSRQGTAGKATHDYSDGHVKHRRQSRKRNPDYCCRSIVSADFRLNSRIRNASQHKLTTKTQKTKKSLQATPRSIMTTKGSEVSDWGA